ncbi:MAG: sulfatase-like hydrolase/transferase [Planctomycetes bacterium]|nr:sulfatase-like hydrolase/transferase [Planctomycetota bacterium]
MRGRLVISLVLMATSCGSVDLPRRPHVVVVLASGLGQGDLGAYNAASQLATPHLDELAAEGLRFADAHATSTRADASRRSLVSGRYPWRSTTVDDGHPAGLDELMELAGYELIPDTTDLAAFERRLSTPSTADTRPIFWRLRLDRDRLSPLPPEGLPLVTRFGRHAEYALRVDHTLGQVLDLLSARGLAPTTMVVFASDRSATWSHHEVQRLGHDANNGWRGPSESNYEAGHRIPLLMRWPGVIEPGSVCDQTVSLTDLYATFEDLFWPTPTRARHQRRDGVSLLPILRRDDLDLPLREATIHHAPGQGFAIRVANWKFVSSPRDGARGWLFDLDEDPAELRDESAEYPEIAERLRLRLSRETPSAGALGDSGPVPAANSVSPW